MNFTTGAMYWVNPKYSEAELRADLQKICENKIGLLRIMIQWECVEIAKDVFDFSVFDRFFHVVEDFSIDLMPSFLFYTPFHRMMEQIADGIDERKRRYPCLDRPGNRIGIEQYITRTVERYKGCPNIKIWNLWNEPTDTLCTCPHSLKKFGAWLKRKYPSRELLKEAWQGEYGMSKVLLPENIDEINENWLACVLEYSKHSRVTALHLDWMEFQSDLTAEHVSYLAEIVRKLDPGRETHTNPNVVTFNPLYAGTDPWKIAKAQDSISGSIHPHMMFAGLEPDLRDYPRTMLTAIALIRSWGAGKDAWIGEYQAGSTFFKPNAYTPRKADITSTLYHALAGGLCGVIFWEWQSWRQSFFEPGEFSLRNPSNGGPTERSEAVREFGEFLCLYNDPVSQLAPPKPEIAIFHSLDQLVMDIELQFNDTPGANRHTQSLFRCHRALMENGYQCDFVTESQILDNVLSNYKIVFLPHVRILSAKIAEKFKQFAVGGGILWADGRCAFLDSHMFLRDRVPIHGLDQLFGCREIDEVAPFEGDLLELNDGSTLPPFREIQRLELYSGAEPLAKCNGFPAAVRNRYEKGIAELWGTYLTANLDLSLTDMLGKFVGEHGVQPSVRILAGENILPSFRSGKDVCLAVMTSIAKQKQHVSVELPVRIAGIVNQVQCSFRNRLLEMELAPYETKTIIVRSV